jgi:hypothetical protein
MDSEKKDPFDGEYIGNIWGWKLSLIGLIVLVFFLGLIAYRHYALDVPLGFEEIRQDQIMESDSTTDEATEK